MAITLQDRIEAAKKALEETLKLYEDGKRQLEKAEAAYKAAIAAALQAKNFVDTLKNTNLSSADALRLASSYLPDPQTYLQQVNQPGANGQSLLAQQINEGTKKLNVTEKFRKQAEREVQQAQKFLNGALEQIDVIKQQLGILTSSISLKKNKDLAKLRASLRLKDKNGKIKLNKVKALLKRNAQAIKAIAKSAAFYVITKILNREVARLSETVQRLRELVDKVNDQIRNIQTKDDVLKARITRDAALVTLTNAERQVTRVRDTLKRLEFLLTIISLLVRALLLIIVPPPAAVIGKIVNAIMTLDALTVMVGVTKSALDTLISEIQYEKSRLLPISDIIDQAINNNLTPEEIGDLLNSASEYGQLGPLDGVFYRGFSFAIYEENDPRFVVAGNKRRYAVALDRSGFVVLRSQASFTLDPTVLVDELKLQIDEQNLEP
jgi:hypothetical protein